MGAANKGAGKKITGIRKSLRNYIRRKKNRKKSSKSYENEIKSETFS